MGLSAALTLSSGGASVILLEKMPTLGRLSKFIEGMFAVNSEIQTRSKVFYTIEDRFKAHMSSTNWMPDARLVRMWMERTAETTNGLRRWE